LDPEVGHRRNGPGHVPRADEGTNRQENEDCAHCHGYAIDGGLAKVFSAMSVLEANDPGDHRAQNQRHLYRSACRVTAEEKEGGDQQGNQHYYRNECIRERRGSWPPSGQLGINTHNCLSSRRAVHVHPTSKGY
jgi:hypothetical protein